MALAGLLILGACTGQQTDGDGHDHMEGDMAHMHVDPPAEFAGLENPYFGNELAFHTGETLYQANCSTCHGPDGAGDGPAAASLDPRPAPIGDAAMIEMVSDGYLFWRISKGGQLDPFNSAMPAWETALSQRQRWQLVTFIRGMGLEDHHSGDDAHND